MTTSKNYVCLTSFSVGYLLFTRVQNSMLIVGWLIALFREAWPFCLLFPEALLFQFSPLKAKNIVCSKMCLYRAVYASSAWIMGFHSPTCKSRWQVSSFYKYVTLRGTNRPLIIFETVTKHSFQLNMEHGTTIKSRL